MSFHNSAHKDTDHPAGQVRSEHAPAPKDAPTQQPIEHPRMDDYRAVALAEGFEEADDPEEVRAAWQHLVNTGMAWTLQGWFGRTAQALIEAGEIHGRPQ